MATVTVWICIITFYSAVNGRQPLLVDNLAYEADCRAVAQLVREEAPEKSDVKETVCISVRRFK